MKRLYVFIPSIFMIACMGKDGVSGRDGRDGEDGDASIALTWVGILYNFATDDPAIPVIFFDNQIH